MKNKVTKLKFGWRHVFRCLVLLVNKSDTLAQVYRSSTTTIYPAICHTLILSFIQFEPFLKWCSHSYDWYNVSTLTFEERLTATSDSLHYFLYIYPDSQFLHISILHSFHIVRYGVFFSHIWRGFTIQISNAIPKIWQAVRLYVYFDSFVTTSEAVNSADYEWVGEQKKV